MMQHAADWIGHRALDTLWALVWHFGIIAGILILALAAAWFIPIGKKVSLIVALCAAVILITAAMYTKLGADYVQAKWDTQNTEAVAAAEKARADAEASVPPLVPDQPHARRVCNSTYDRDPECSPKGFSPYNLFKLKRHRAHSASNPGSQRHGPPPSPVEVKARSAGQ